MIELAFDLKEKAGRWDYVLSCSILKLYEEFKENPFDKVEIHTISIDDFAIATNPFEFYCQFGIDIKRRSPFNTTIISQLTNGCEGILPDNLRLFWRRIFRNDNSLDKI